MGQTGHLCIPLDTLNCSRAVPKDFHHQTVDGALEIIGMIFLRSAAVVSRDTIFIFQPCPHRFAIQIESMAKPNKRTDVLLVAPYPLHRWCLVLVALQISHRQKQGFTPQSFLR